MVHGIQPTCIRRMLHLFFAESEAKLGHQVLYLFKAELDLNFIWLLRVVPVQGADIDPQSSDFQYLIKCVHVLEDVVSRVDKEACNNAVPLLDPVAKHIHEFSLCHREVIFICIIHLEGGASVWNFDLFKGILVAF